MVHANVDEETGNADLGYGDVTMPLQSICHLDFEGAIRLTVNRAGTLVSMAIYFDPFVANNFDPGAGD